MKCIYPLLVLFVMASFGGYAQKEPESLQGAGVFKFDDTLDSIFHDILTLKLRSVIPRITKEKREHPYNLISYYLEDYIEFFHAFIDGKPKDIYGKYMERKEKRLEWLQQGGEGDPYTLYVQADIHLRWGMIYAYYQDNMEAFKSIKKASVLLEKNTKKFPNFLPNRRANGILHTMVGAIPGKYQWGATLAGLKGDVARGLTELEGVINYGKKYSAFEFNEEVQIIYGMLLLYMGNNDMHAWGVINTALLDYNQNPMAAYILANRSIKIGKSKNAILILDKYPRGEEYHYFPYLDIMTGMCKLYRLDYKAETDFNNFLSKYRGVNGIKEAYHRLAWISLLKGDQSKYKYYMTLVEKKGEHNTSQDRTAMNEMEGAKENVIPNIYLLKARLLSDGGYYEKAYHEMESCKPKTLKTEEEKVEYCYRKGRIFQKMRKNDEALINYGETIKLGTKKPYYFACNAALQAGIIWQSRGDKDKAKSFYEKCLKEKPDQYKASLHTKARVKLAELKDKE
jgi:tetratricopeptide (TPR) repeat protein